MVYFLLCSQVKALCSGIDCVTSQLFIIYLSFFYIKKDIAPLHVDNFIYHLSSNLSQVSHWPGGLCYETEAYRLQQPHKVLVNL